MLYYVSSRVEWIWDLIFFTLIKTDYIPYIMSDDSFSSS